MLNPQYEKSIPIRHDFTSIRKKANRKVNVKNTLVKSNVKISQIVNMPDKLFREMRNLNEEETKEYRNILKNDFKNTGVNFFDIL